MLVWWAHQDSNLGPTGYEPVALPAELWALLERGYKANRYGCDFDSDVK